MKIALITNYNNTEKYRSAKKVAEYLSERNAELYLAESWQEKITDFPHVTFLPSPALYSTADAIIVMGGDGSILEGARTASEYGVPVLGINLGHLGYMAELEMNRLSQLDALLNGTYCTEERSMLSVTVQTEDGKIVGSANALNDAVVSNGSVSRIIDLSLLEDGKPVATYRADGLIVATPTGSTAYSMSAGGAIVDPRVSCLCITPICPHSFGARPMIFPDHSNLQIKNICKRERALYLTVDGRISFEVRRNQSVFISKSDKIVKLIRLEPYHFCDTLRKKMGELL